jgi:predicted RNase H-like HicB family nuclease
MQSNHRKYLVIYERSSDGYSAYIPDLPGCTSAGETRDEIEENIVEAIKFHLEMMEEEGLPIPLPVSQMLVIA